MKIRNKTIYWSLLATATIAGLTWASDVVVLNPATISGNVAFSDTIQSYTVYAYPSIGGNPAQQSFSAPVPASYSLTVEGGDPMAGAGKDYQPAIVAYFQGIRPGAGAYLQIYKNTSVHVSSPDGNATGVDFTPTTSHLNASIEVQGGTLYDYDISAGCNTSDTQYYGQSYESLPSPYPSSVTSWIVMGPCSQASASGTAYVVADDGTMFQHQLEPKTGDLSWLVDLTDTGTLAGNVSLTSTSGVGSVSVSYYGAYGTPSYGTSGSIPASSPPGSPYVAAFSGTVPSGTYDVFAQICTQNGASCSDTATSRVMISHTPSPLPLIFSDALAATQIPLAVTGFYDNTSLSYAQLQLSRPDPNQEVGLSAYSSLQNGTYNFGLPTGSWNFSYLYLSINDNTDPNLAVQSSLYRFHENDQDHPPFSVASGTPSTLPPEQVTLVKSNLYFQVGSADGGSINVSSPNVTAYKYDYNADHSLKTYFQVSATGSSMPKPIAGLTMIAEPGTYTLDARATVNGTLTPFGGTTITFGAPLQTNPTTTDSHGNPIPEHLVLTPPGQALEVDVTYNNVSVGGITTVVQSELGPSPPEGLSVACDDMLGGNNSGNTLCPPVYYDIKTNATWSGQTEVCIQHRFDSYDNGFSYFLHLWHFNETLPPDQQWEQLPFPPDDPPLWCNDNPDLCNQCPDDPGVPGDPNNPLCGHTFRICGLTTSFSPFVVASGTQMTSTFQQTTYSGPSGPIQSLTVPATAVYHIIANGATGGKATTGTTKSGGCGAHITGDFMLHQGDVLQVLVGQQGTSTAQNGGGGGGTFVALNGAPLIVAGGGGGIRTGATVNGLDGSTISTGGSGSTSADHTTGLVLGGTGGLGGKHAAGFGAGGGGWSGNGEADGVLGEGGWAFLATGANQGKGGVGKTCGTLANGGFGGGGAGNGCFGGGGGGGYSGGGGGRVAGGGGSWNTGTNPTASTRCTANGQGFLMITPPSATP